MSKAYSYLLALNITRMCISYLYILALWWTCLVESSSIMQECINYNYTHASMLDNKLYSHRLLWKKNSTKKLECANTCFQEKACVSFQVNEEKSLCRGYAVTFNPNSMRDKGQGYVLYESEKAAGFIGSSCQSNAECTVPDSVCVNSECMCDPGLSFSPRSGTCNATCTAYGNHYTAVLGYEIVDNDMVTFRHVTDEQCRDHCTIETGFVCRSADYDTVRRRCHLTSATLKTVNVANYRIEKGFPTITHLVRECEI